MMDGRIVVSITAVLLVVVTGVLAILADRDRIDFIDKCIIKHYGTANDPTGGIRDYCKALERQQ